MGVRPHLRPLWLGAPNTGALAPDLSENVGPVPSAACCLFRRPGLSNEAPTRNSFPDEKHRAPPGASKEDLMRPSHTHTHNRGQVILGIGRPRLLNRTRQAGPPRIGKVMRPAGSDISAGLAKSAGVRDDC